ncbi:MAG: hypothetical protein KatS3mg061_1888 [Dehalococcoidia bacterium]|nr:MAG: hypothetical protein KatS3mg061_1888 [Dehalococcoidia bacterium]
MTVPFVARLLAEHGAEVIKVAWGARLAPCGSFPRSSGTSSPNVGALWNLVNASKRSVTLDLNQPRARAFVRSLVQLSDVVIDDFGVDPLPRWGLTPLGLRALRPDLILARSSVYVRSGLLSGMP